MKLVFPAPEHKQAALEYRKEYLEYGEMTINGSSGIVEAESYEEWLAGLHIKMNQDDGVRVPATVYFSICDGHIIGTIQIRHKLNDFLTKYGGHIGYAVRPSRRCRGYATRMLALALDKCHEMGIGMVLVTCDKDNLASAKTILRCGGVLEDEIAREGGDIVQRYWIDTTT